MKEKFKKILSKKNLKLLIGIAVLLILVWIITSTYSKYINTIDGTASMGIANWNIKINNQNITQNSDFTNVLGFVLDSSEHIANNVIVPTSSGSFTINLESTGTDLPFEYDFSISESIDSSSTYYTTQAAAWGNETQGYNYQLSFNIDYTYLDKPIVYRFNRDYNYVVNELHQPWGEGTGWGLVYNGININHSGVPLDTEAYGSDPVGLPITLTLPPGMSVERVYNCVSFNYDAANSTVTFIPVYYNWFREGNISYDSHIAEWDEHLTISEYCTTNTAEILLDLKYVPPGGVNSLSDAYWTSVSAEGRTIMKKNLADFKITRYQLNDGEIHTLAPGETNITGVVQPSLNQDGTNTGNQVLNTFRFWVEWYDGSDNLMNNSEDVKASKSDDPTGTIPISAKITQVRP